jgi:NADH-quinone oxidoreductase subunit N
MNALLLSAIFGVVMMLLGIGVKKQALIRTVAIAGMAILLIVNWMEKAGIHFFHFDVTAFMVFDSFSLTFNAIVIFSTLVFFLVAGRDMERAGKYYPDYFALIFFILCGIFITTSFTSLLTLFLGIEIISIPLYILTGADKRNLKSNEASLKYFLMGSFSTGIMLMGITLIYGSQATFSVDHFNFAGFGSSRLVITGMLFLLFAVSFKASVAPFHFWAPDVYDGAPTAFTSFMATVVKVGVFAGFVRLFNDSFFLLKPTWQVWVAIFIVLTLLIGNVTAVFQQSVKRMLAYSSVSHAGFMLFAIFALNSTGYEGLLIYGLVYSMATIGLFAVLAKMKDYTYEGFNGLARYRPELALITAICLFSLAGIPLTGGFLAKFYMLRAAILTGHYVWLVIFAVVMAAVGVYYYFRVIRAMYFKNGPDPGIEVSPMEMWALRAICVVLILMGLFPQLLLNWYYF